VTFRTIPRFWHSRTGITAFLLLLSTIWVPSPENRDLRQLLWHRHRLVQMRTRIMNQLQALAMNEGYRWKKKLFSEQGRAQSGAGKNYWNC
jgi:transposase